MGADVFLVIPAYREINRLPPYLRELAGVLSSAPFTTEILVVDDGSPPEEQQKLRAALIPGTIGSCTVLEPRRLPVNHGKGQAIIEGWRSADTVKWFGFVDADGAIPSYEVLRVLNLAMQSSETSPPCFWASRVLMLGKKVERSVSRHLLGRVFATLVSLSINLPVYDTQCGFKVIPHRYRGEIMPLLREARFCFDVELLLAVRHAGATVLETPIDWRDVPGGPLHPVRDGIAMVRRLPEICQRAKNWPAPDRRA